MLHRLTLAFFQRDICMDALNLALANTLYGEMITKIIR